MPIFVEPDYLFSIMKPESSKTSTKHGKGLLYSTKNWYVKITTIFQLFNGI